MAIVAVGNVKGGVGKTTTAVNLAIVRGLAGKDVLLIDGDEQATTMAFTELRTEAKRSAGEVDDQGNGRPGYTVVALQGAAIRTQVRQLARKYDDIVIDVGGRDTGSLRAALTVADTLLIPVKPRSFDLWGVDQTADLVREAREINDQLRAVAFINEADPQGKDNQVAQDYIRGVEGVELAPMMIGRRKAFPNAAALGLSVVEHDDPKASDELKQLSQFVYVHTSDIGALSYGNR